MLKNYISIIFRNLWKNKLYTSVNVISLAIGIASIVWGFQTYRYSFSFNNFHKDQSSIFRVVTKVAGNDNFKGYCPQYLAQMAKNDFPEVKDAVRWDSRGLNVKAEQSDPFESQAHFTDPHFFDFFNFPLLRGTVQIENHATVVITEKAAKKFFGNTDPIGKTLIFYSDEPFKLPLKVTGILKNPPLNSSFQFEMITNNDNQLRPDGSVPKFDGWLWLSDAVFLKLSNPASAANLAGKFEKYLPLQHAVSQDVKLKSFMLDPLSQVANEFYVENNALYQRPSDSATYGPLVLSILILLSACLNFANTSVAKSNSRLKEMGVRKVMGSTVRQILLQQLMECAFIVLMAIVLSVLINNFWLPTFNSMFRGVKVEAHYFGDLVLFGFLISILLAVTLIAGAYPAFYVSRFNAANIFRGSVKFGGSNLFSRLLLGLQVTISFITVIAGVAFSRNSAFQNNYDYGYDKTNLFSLSLQNQPAFTSLRDALNKIPGVEKLAGTVNNVGFSYSRIPLQAKGTKEESIYIRTGDNYLDVMKLKLAAGRNFSRENTSDIGKSIIINEKLAFRFGWKPGEAIGKQIYISDTSFCTVIGVLKDFTQNTLFEPLQSVAMVQAKSDDFSQIIVRAKQGSLGSVFAETKKAWGGLYPLRPFRSYYQDELAAEAAQVNESVATIFFWFAIISVIMAATSMFALVSLNVLKKSKEIAIRKVVGAEDRHIFQLVMKGYSWILLISAAIGCYAGFSLARLLMDLIFRINSGVSTSSLVLSFISVLVICGGTIGVRVWLVLRTKATDALKSN